MPDITNLAIVLPMAGLSARFRKAGYEHPKYMLEANGRTLFRYSAESFRHYWNTAQFIFICRDVSNTPDFIQRECDQMGIERRHVAVLADATRGQAETVIRGLEGIPVADETSLLIFNIDTYRPGYRWPAELDPSTTDGYLEVFDGDGANWSYVRPMFPGSNRVAETAEKRPISRLCSTGLYHFGAVTAFREAYRAAEQSSQWGAPERYVAPLYNHLIEGGHDIRFSQIDRSDVVFLGTPEEYEQFIREEMR